MVSIMKIEDDAALNSYLVKHLQPLTEADPNILAKYVWALLKNNKPRKELQAFCAEKLVDFLGEGSKNFVVNLFHALEDGTILTNEDECDIKVADDSSTMPPPPVVKVALTEDTTEPRTSSQLQKHPDASSLGLMDHEEEGSDDEDDDRNHKHRRRVQRSRSLDRDTQDGPFRKRNRPAIANPPTNDNNSPLDEIQRGLSYVEKDGLPKRRFGRDHVSGAPPRLGMDVNQHGVPRGTTLLRNDGLGSRFEHQNGLSRGVMGRGRGATTGLLSARGQRTVLLDGTDVNLPMLPPGLPKNMYTGRSSSSRGNPSHPSWTGYNRFTGMTNGTLDQALPSNTGMQGSRGVPVSAALGVGMDMGMGMALRPRCPDFEERGYCLRGDLCPMEHGANRIVVEDVQSLSKYNLQVALPSGRGMGLGTVSVSSSSLAPYSSNLGHPSIVMRETVASNTNATAEPDLYDPDQPLWNKEQPALVDGIRRLPAFRKDSEPESAALERSRRQSPDNEGYGKPSLTGVRPQGSTSGQSVWNRIGGRTDHGDGKDDSRSLFTDSHVESSQFPKAPKRESVEAHEPQNLPTKWRNDPDERAARTMRSPSMKGVVNSTTEGEVGLHPAGYNPLGGRDLRPSSERAQKTLYVGCLPSNPNRRELLMAHFQKFGDIVDIRVPPHGDRAFVQFLRHEDAEAALISPEAVMGNRFIRLSWAKRDSVPTSFVEGSMALPSIGHGRGTGLGGVQGLVTETSISILKGKKQVGATSTASEINANRQVTKSGSTVQPSSSAMPQKKQEELEHMKEELRRKQEELAQKRDEFRRRLERLTKQGNGTAPELENNGATGARGAGSKAELKEDQVTNNEVMPDKQEVTIKDDHKQTSLAAVTVENVLLSSDQAALGLAKDPSRQPLGPGQMSSGNLSQPSPKGLRGHSPRPSAGFVGTSQWTPLRYKLDNRTTVFRVLPPFPDSLLDVATLKQHFQCFGDVANVEIEDLDKKIEANHTGKHTAKVTFATRNVAEKAYVQGRWYEGTSLHFSWVNPPPSNSAGVTSLDSVHTESINDTSRISSSVLAEKGSENGQSSKIQTSAAEGCSEMEGRSSETEGRLMKDCVSAFQPCMDEVLAEGTDLDTKTDG
eukprot:c16226_g1_i2 orf=753-4109(-)